MERNHVSVIRYPKLSLTAAIYPCIAIAKWFWFCSPLVRCFSTQKIFNRGVSKLLFFSPLLWKKSIVFGSENLYTQHLANLLENLENFERFFRKRKITLFVCFIRIQVFKSSKLRRAHRLMNSFRFLAS